MIRALAQSDAQATDDAVHVFLRQRGIQRQTEAALVVGLRAREIARAVLIRPAIPGLKMDRDVMDLRLDSLAPQDLEDGAAPSAAARYPRGQKMVRGAPRSRFGEQTDLVHVARHRLILIDELAA